MTISEVMELINQCIELLSIDGINGKAQAKTKLMTAYNALNEIINECDITYPDEDFLINDYYYSWEDDL